MKKLIAVFLSIVLILAAAAAFADTRIAVNGTGEVLGDLGNFALELIAR